MPSKSIPVLDALKFEYQVHMVLNSLPVSKDKLAQIKEATANDPVLQKLTNIIVDGWPEAFPSELHAYFSIGTV